MDRLYHYCPTQSFSAIVSTRSIWLSSLTLANDSMEGKLVKNALIRLAERDGLNNHGLQRLQEVATNSEIVFDGLGFCLSEEGDLLSQWRGYADDGKGISIGFSRRYLENLTTSMLEEPKPGFTLQKVRYSPEEHETQVEPTYRQLRKLIDDGTSKNPVLKFLLNPATEEEIVALTRKMQDEHESLFYTLWGLFEKLYALKTSAFREEQEWRLISFLVSGLSDECLFHERRNIVVPYRKFDLPLDRSQPIVEVILGPKNQTPANVIARMLKHAGFGEVIVRRSVASYR